MTKAGNQAPERETPERETPEGETRARHRIGMGLMALAMLLVPVLDVIAKVLMEQLSPMEVAAGRFSMQSLLLLPLVALSRSVPLPRVGHLLAGALLGLALLTFNFAIRAMPIANALAIFFVEPLVLILLARFVLGEELKRQRLVAIAIGLSGALLVLRPNFAAYGAASFWPFATAVLFAGYLLTTRIFARRESPLALQFWSGVFAAVTLLLCLALFGPQGLDLSPVLALTGKEALLFLALGLLAALAHQLIVRALAFLEAGAAAPFQYLELVSATLLGWLVFGDLPDAVTALGAAIIVVAGLWVFRHDASR